MAKKAFVSLTGGLNNVDRPDTLEEDQLQECVNYEITGVGRLEKRTDPSQYSEDLTTKLNEHFSEIIFVSDPYYPPNKMQGDFDDYMLFVYGIVKDSGEYRLEAVIPGTIMTPEWTGKYERKFGRRYKVYVDVPVYEWSMQNETTQESYLKDMYDAGLEYTKDSNIDISIGDRCAYVNDGVNPIHKITITPRGEFVASYAGLKAPKNKPRVSLKALGDQYHAKSSSITYTSDVTDATLGGIGLLQVQYTVVTAIGVESNPSPMSDWANGQFFKIGEDGVSDEKLIKSITIHDLNIPEIPLNLQKDLKYFKIYYRIVRYSEGVELDSMEFSVQEEIKNKTTEAFDTGNSYIISTIKSVGQAISYENDAGMPCKTSAVNAGVVMVGGVTKSASIPGDFQYMTPITVRNNNLGNYVDAVVQVKLSTNDIVDDYGNTIMDNWSYYFHPGSDHMAGERGIEWNDEFCSRHLRIYDTDMTTPIMVYVPYTYKTIRTEADELVGEIDIYVKIPLLAASADHTIYFCYNKLEANLQQTSEGDIYLDSGHEGIENKYNDISKQDPPEFDDSDNADSTKFYKADGTTEIDKEDNFTWENNIGIHYGRWCLGSDVTLGALSRQQVFQHRRVPSGSTEILTAPNTDDLGLGDVEKSMYDLANRANLTNNGEATSIDDPLMVQNCINPPTECPFEIVEDGDPYEYGGKWLPTAETETKYHYTSDENYAATGSRINTLHKSTDMHHGAPAHNAYSDNDGYYIRYDDDGNESPQSHTHTVAGSPGEWKDDTIDFEYVQTYKLAVKEALADNVTSTRGLAPITTLDTTGNNIDNYSLSNEAVWGTFPLGLDKLYMIPGVFQLKMPVLQEESESVSRKYDTSTPGTRDDGSSNRAYYNSVGSFKPWCAGWSFRKQALSIGQMPDRGYFYTTITFRKKDLVDRGLDIQKEGIAHGGTTWDAFDRPTGVDLRNTIFYISCGSINDPDALPNNPVTHYDDHYDSASRLGVSDVEGKDTGYADNEYIRQDSFVGETGRSGSGAVKNGNYLPMTKGYNRDNFRPTSITGLSPGDTEDEGLTEQEGGSGLPHWSAHTLYGVEGDDVKDEQDPKLDLDPKRNLISLTIERYVSDYNPKGGLDLTVQIGTVGGYTLHDASGNIGKLKMQALKDVEADVFVSVFVYMSWDMIDEKVTVGWSLVDTETENLRGTYTKSSNNHYGHVLLEEFDLTASNMVPEGENFQDRFKDKPLYDIGLGSSTYINRVSSFFSPYSEEQAQKYTQSGFHGFYGATEMTINDYISDKNQIFAMRNGTPRYAIPVGVNWDDRSQNNNISFSTTKDKTQRKYDNMIMWSELGGDGFPDLNYKLLKEPVLDILSAPSFLKFEYSNTFLIFTRNTINRFVLKGSPSGWAGSSDSLIEEQLQFGLFAPKSLVKVGSEIVWYSEEGVIRWSAEGMQNISNNVIDIPLNGYYIAFYCPMKNQYILHDNATYISYAYDMTYRMWTTFKGMNIISSSILSRGSESENLNLLLNGSDRTIYKYPGEEYTSEDARIKTMDLFMDSGLIKRVKVAYNGDSDAKLTYNLAYNDKDSNNIERSQEIDAIEKNAWRGLGDLGRIYGRVANFEIENADEIFTIIYDAVARGND